jgi:hypothetical protein
MLRRSSPSRGSLPDTVFVVGADTAERIVDPRYLRKSRSDARTALQEIRENGCRFLTPARAVDGVLRELSPTSGSRRGYGDLFERRSPSASFREDVSSSEIRKPV